jgi:hypothetical protein
LFLDRVPEIGPDFGVENVISPGWVWCEVVGRLVDEDSAPRCMDGDVWLRVLALVEVVLTLSVCSRRKRGTTMTSC